MMKKLNVLVILIFISIIFLFLLYCSSSPNTIEDDNYLSKTNPGKILTRFYDIDFDELVDDGVNNIINAYMEDGNLAIEVEYFGECTMHEFTLVSSGMVSMSEGKEKAETEYYLFHNSNGDTCDTLKTKTLYFKYDGNPDTDLIMYIYDGQKEDKFVTIELSSSNTYIEKYTKENPGDVLVDDGKIDINSFIDDGVELMDVYVEGEYLVIDVAYGGGCEEHEFILYWDGKYYETEPEQVDLMLFHNSNNDMCEAYIHHTLYFKLAFFSPITFNIIDGNNYENSISFDYGF